MPVERVTASAEGRIFSGRDGKGRGLIDELGGLSEAIVRARALAALPEDAPFDVAEEPEGILRFLADSDPKAAATAPASASVAQGAAWSLARAVPGLAPFAGSVASLIAGERVLCALPFALTVR